MEIVHTPVMVNEILEFLLKDSDRTLLDCTTGEGGHSEAFLKSNPLLSVTCLDRDADILNVAKDRLEPFDGRVNFVNCNFADVGTADTGFDKYDAALIDLGISVYHYKVSGRGFSFVKDEMLDMRLDESGLSAHEIVNTFPESRLKEIFFKFGEERFSQRIAAKIVEARNKNEIRTAKELAEIVDRAVPAKFKPKNIHSATKVFQALRIVANSEFDHIEKGIPAVLSKIKKGGRLGVITFHSLEDRIVKRMFNYMALDCICPREVPYCACGKVKEVSFYKKLIVPGDEECRLNPPSRSAKLRIVEKLVD